MLNQPVHHLEQSLTVMSCRSMRRSPRCHRSRERHSFWLELRELAGGAWRTGSLLWILWDTAPLSHVSVQNKWLRQLNCMFDGFLSWYMLHLSSPCTTSHVTTSQRRGERRSQLLLCYTGGDGEGHQGKPLPGARRVWCQPLWYQNWLDPRSGGYGSYLHPRRQPSG